MEKFCSMLGSLRESKLFGFLDKFQKTILVLSGVCVFLLTVVTVVLRYIFEVSVFGLDEVILIVVFWLYFIGAAQGSLENSHIKADMIATLVRNRRIVELCHLLARIIEAAVIAVCVVWSVTYIIKDISVMPYTVVLKIPLIASHVAMTLSFSLMLFYGLIWLADQIRIVCGVFRTEGRQS